MSRFYTFITTLLFICTFYLHHVLILCDLPFKKVFITFVFISWTWFLLSKVYFNVKLTNKQSSWLWILGLTTFYEIGKYIGLYKSKEIYGNLQDWHLWICVLVGFGFYLIIKKEVKHPKDIFLSYWKKLYG